MTVPDWTAGYRSAPVTPGTASTAHPVGGGGVGMAKSNGGSR